MGCGKFDDKVKLVSHLIFEHASELWVWGLSRDLLPASLENKARTLTKDSNADQVGLSNAMEANSPESFLAKQLDDIAEQKTLKFKQTYLVADEQIVTSEWVIHRNNYKRALLKPRSILNFLQSYHFISRLQAQRPQCVPELPRIEIANKQVISIGF